MAPRQKFVKKFYRRLAISQIEDTFLSPAGVLEIKLNLKHYSQCAQLTLQNDTKHAFVSHISLQPLPNFFRSQIEGQRLSTDPLRITVQVATVLAFVDGFLTTKPKGERSRPTLFTWHLPDNPRTYCLFAYLTHNMVSRTYSVTELLELRGSQSCRTLLNKVRMNPDLVDIIKGHGNNSHSRRLKKTKRDIQSSTDSEELIVFQGKRHLRHPIPAAELPMEWKYRSLDDTERAPIEPLPAPPSLVAQQSEGFQRFFKAVVSPSHVRVTAGGRIVPNTRTSSSPTAKWDKEQQRPVAEGAVDEMSKQQTAESGSRVDKHTKATTTDIMVPPMASPMYPVMPPMFHPMTPMGGVPMPLVPMHGGGMPYVYGLPHAQHPQFPPTVMHNGMPYMAAPPHTLPPPVLTPPIFPPPTLPPQAPERDGEKHDTETAEKGHEGRKPKPTPIKISPVAQFDPNRPFFYAGQVVYPSPVPGQLPPQMTPYFPHGYPINPAMLQAGGIPFAHPPTMPPMLGPAEVKPGALGQPSDTGTPNKQQISKSSPEVVPTAPLAPAAAALTGVDVPVTSIRPSQITKNQLFTLGQTLKYYEDQLQFNRHQIDEKKMQSQIENVKAQIELFGDTYKMQASLETNLPRQTTPQATGIHDYLLKEKDRRHKPGMNYCKAEPFPASANHTSAIHAGATHPHATQPGLNGVDKFLRELDAKGSQQPSLPAFTASAAPFEPRDATNVHVQAPSAVSESRAAYLARETARDEAILVAAGKAGFGRVNPDGIPPIGLTMSEAATPHCLDQTGAVPYLSGTLPPGVNPYTATQQDYTYPRELTYAELQAREVYWGRRSGRGLGLPKFDGRDFYAPSRAKVTEGRPQDMHNGHSRADDTYKVPVLENDPFRSSQEAESTRPTKAKYSRAVPIVNPNTMTREYFTTKDLNDSNAFSSQVEDLDKILKADKLQQSLAPSEPAVRASDDMTPTSLSRRALERSSTKSNNDHWPNMLKNGITGGTVLPSALTPTTATGYLPQYYPGYAAASLSPAIMGPRDYFPPGTSRLRTEQGAHDKKPGLLGENCPPDHVAPREAKFYAA